MNIIITSSSADVFRPSPFFISILCKGKKKTPSTIPIIIEYKNGLNISAIVIIAIMYASKKK